MFECRKDPATFLLLLNLNEDINCKKHTVKYACKGKKEKFNMHPHTYIFIKNPLHSKHYHKAM